jgi:hypothetical protein
MSPVCVGWGLRVAPPGWTLVEKERAEEMQRRDEEKKRSKFKSVERELKIEY